MRKIKNIFIIGLYGILFLIPLEYSEKVYAQNQFELIDTKEKLEFALLNANDGDTINIGNISYLPDDMWLTVNKNIILKSGLENRVTINGGLGIRGGTIESEKINVKLENINFIGANDLSTINLIDGEYLQSQSHLTLKQCIVISGFVNIEIENCDFIGFAQTVGGAINAMYGKAGASENCRLSLSIKNCKFNSNIANQGSALYLYGYNNNIKFDMINSEIGANVQQRAPIALFGTIANIKHSTIANNQMINFNSSCGGGGIFAKESELNLIDCRIINNQATDGGALYLYYTRAFIDGCIIADNAAREITVESIDWDYDTSEEIYNYETLGGNGGGIYIDANQLLRCYIVNCSIYRNNAYHDGGAIFVNYRNDATINVECALSTIGTNSIQNGKLIASTSQLYSTDLFGCLLISDEYKIDSIYMDENYNYFGSQNQFIDANIFSQNYIETNMAHIIPDYTNLSAIPQTELRKWANGKYKNIYGVIHIGANGTQPTTIIYIGEGQKQIVAYSEKYSLLSPSRVGFIFEGWKTDNKSKELFDENKLLLGGELILYSKWKPKAITIVMPLVALFIISIGIIIIIYFKKRGKNKLQIIPNTVADETESASLTINKLIKENIISIVNDYKLSTREAEVLEHLLEGKSTRKIAEELFISFETVRFHNKNIYKKLSVHSQMELISFCQNYIKK